MKIHEHARQMLLSSADHNVATCVANKFIRLMEDQLNEASASDIHGGQTTMATSLVVRVMLARALLEVAAAWWAEVVKLPLPEASLALRGLVSDPPPCWDTIITNEAE